MSRFRVLAPLAALALTGCADAHVVVAGPTLESPYRNLASLGKEQIVHRATGRSMSPDELMDYLARFPVVYVGETHDNVEAHRVELRILQGLAERRPGGLALGLEMLRRPFQGDVDAYLRGEMTEREFVRVWSQSWGPRSWRYYRDILRYARQQRIPVLALNAGSDLADAVRDHGLEGLEPELAARLPEFDLDDPYHRAFIEGIFRGHTHGPPQVDAFYRVLVLWEETMAQAAADYLSRPENAERQLLVFAGGNHVRYGFGIPRRLFRRLPRPFAIVEAMALEIGEDMQDRLMEVETPDLPLPPADVYWTIGYEALERGVMLGIRVEDAPEGGARVLSVWSDSPAERAGIESGDVIVAVDGQPVKETFDLTYQIELHEPGDSGAVEVLRGDERLTLQVTYEIIRRDPE